MSRFSLVLILLTLPVASSSPHQAEINSGWIPPQCETHDRLYWEARQIVTVIMHCDTSGKVTSVELMDQTLAEDCADSLLALTRQWGQRAQMRRPDRRRPYMEFAFFAIDRQDSYPSDAVARTLPQFGKDALGEPPLSGWVTAWASHTPGFTLDHFVTCGYKPMHRVGGGGLLNTPYVDSKEDHGLLHSSPNGRYVLDPFAGMEVTDTGRAAWGVDTGYATYDARTGDRLHYSVGTMSVVFLARWTSASNFILLGMATLDRSDPRRHEPDLLRLPAIWIGDVKNEKIALYLGLPALTVYRSAAAQQLAEIRASAYPDIVW